MDRDERQLVKEIQAIGKLEDLKVPRWLFIAALTVFGLLALAVWLLA